MPNQEENTSNNHLKTTAHTRETLCALSPLDGRYQSKTAALRQFCSEFALIRYRIQVEVEWLITLAGLPEIDNLAEFSDEVIEDLRHYAQHFNLNDAERVKELEKTTNHDVKAVEYALREYCQNSKFAAELEPAICYLHFACTSEDINNCAYALMQRDVLQNIMQPQLESLIKKLRQLAYDNASLAMLARTHGQAASPTTIGKELHVFITRLQNQLQALVAQPISAKFNGAVGNYHAHIAAYPEIDWPAVCGDFIREKLLLTSCPISTQIEPHDNLSAFLQHLCRINNILIDLCHDIWGYISLGYLQQKVISDEVGSSTMPHKVNPIDFENAEGNLGLSNALAEHFIRKLPISRWQRDLSDSTTLRNLGSIIGYGDIAYQSLQKGLNKIHPNTERLQQDLNNRWEVIAEAIQSVMRRYGVQDAYEQLKQLSRGQQINQELLHAFINKLNIPSEAKERLLKLTPEKYIGLAATQVPQPPAGNLR